MGKRITKSIVPNLLTLANLFSGFTAIIHISDGMIERAALFILLAAIFDLLDGMVARILNATSEIGVELDSLSDAVSFGVAPAYMLYSAFFYQFGENGIFYAAMPALAGITRLARFNVTSSALNDKRYFIGLPIPSAALTIISYVVFVKDKNYVHDGYTDYIVFGLTILVSFAMISTVKYDSIPKPQWQVIKQKPIFMAYLFISVLLVVFSSGVAIFPVMMIYILFYLIKHYIVWILSFRNPEDDIDESAESEKTGFDI